jgi:outer membrane protein
MPPGGSDTASTLSLRRFGVPALVAAALWCAGCALWPLPEHYDTYPAPLPGNPPAAPAAGPWAGNIHLPAEGPLKLALDDAILLALDNNPQYRVQRYKPQITQTAEDVARAKFDSDVSGSVSASRSREQQPLTTGGVQNVTTNQTRVTAGVTQILPTGTGVQVQASENRTQSLADLGRSDLRQFRVGLTVTQSLLRGFGAAANLAELRQARIDTAASEYELRGEAEDLVAGAEETYWNYALAQRSIDIFQQSVDVARKQLSDAQERVRVGKLAASELAAIQAELSKRQEDLINARSQMEKTRIKLLQIVSPQGAGALGRQVDLLDQPTMTEQQVGAIDDHVELALRMRPDLNQARLQVQRGDLDIVRTANGLLPKLDAFIQLGKSGYGTSYSDSFSHVKGDYYDALAGFNFEYPPGNREARANHRAAVLNRAAAAEAVANLAQTVEVDVRNAFVEVDRAHEQVAATRATREFREETLRAETEKFRNGKSTSLLVAQAERDLVASQIDEVQAVVSYLIALTELYRVDGSLLLRHGINAPGQKPEDNPVQ